MVLKHIQGREMRIAVWQSPLVHYQLFLEDSSIHGLRETVDERQMCLRLVFLMECVDFYCILFSREQVVYRLVFLQRKSVTDVSQATAIAVACGRGFRARVWPHRVGDPVTAYMENLYSEATVAGRRKETVVLCWACWRMSPSDIVPFPDLRCLSVVSILFKLYGWGYQFWISYCSLQFRKLDIVRIAILFDLRTETSEFITRQRQDHISVYFFRFFIFHLIILNERTALVATL
jgi:hypothetical protein